MPTSEPIILSRIGPEDNWIPDCLSETLKVECDDGYYIITDHRTIVYGDGDTALEALHDYIISLIEYTELLFRRSRRGG